MRSMDEFEANSGSGGPPKKGVVIAIAALVVVLVAGFAAYQLLIGQAGGRAALQAQPGAAAGAGAGAGGSEAPYLADYDATVYTIEEAPVALTQIADGRPLVMNFWATWCPYCIQEMDDYQAIYDDYKDRVSFAFIDCADGVREKPYDAALWLVDNGYDDLPAYYDTTQEAMYAFGASALPTTVVVAADGEIMTISAGAIDPSLMRSALDSLL